MKTLVVAFGLLAAFSVAAADPAAAEARWAAVLERFVDDGGRVDFEGLAADRADLDAYLEFVAEVGPDSDPELFPTREARLAHYLNSYNALAMAGILESGIPESLGSVFRRYSFFKKRKVDVAGERMSLHRYENELIRATGEPRIHFALNCMSGGCPRLPREPFRADSLDAQLEAVALEFFNAERHVRVEADRGRVYLSEILEWFEEDFVNDRVAGSLVEYVNRYRSEPVPEGLKVRFIPYDWTVIAR